jgi:putative SOS response-associated peptidase YedK
MALFIRETIKRLTGEMMTWVWNAPLGKPVFNLVSENRDFSHSNCCLILATVFYEYTDPAPAKPKVKLKDQHRFVMKSAELFWITGIIKQGCFAILTTEPGPDIKPYHDRQIVRLAPEVGLDWLTLAKRPADLLAAPPKGKLMHRQTRRDGVD